MQGQDPQQLAVLQPGSMQLGSPSAPAAAALCRAPVPYAMAYSWLRPQGSKREGMSRMSQPGGMDRKGDSD